MTLNSNKGDDDDDDHNDEEDDTNYRFGRIFCYGLYLVLFRVVSSVFTVLFASQIPFEDRFM